MSFFRRLIAEVLNLFLGTAHERRTKLMATEKEAGTYEGPSLSKSRDFDADYKAAVRMLRERLDRKFPDGPYAKLRSGASKHHDPRDDRALAVDTMSTAIAMALRDGATVKQAAEAGAASVGI
ncbi:hypothetical protein ACLBX9_12885 [Methylobacterium sp. A49B]